MKPVGNGAKLVVELRTPSSTETLGAALAAEAIPGMVLGLVGPLGAGKTLLTRSLATALGVDPGTISSPTFVLIQEYEGTLPVYHFDTYRLSSPDQFEGLGPWEYFDAAGVCVVEWADRVADQLPTRTVWMRIELTGPESRRVTIEAPEDAAWLGRVAERLAVLDAPAPPT